MKKLKIAQLGIGHNHASEVMRTARRLSDRFEVMGFSPESEEWYKKRGGLDVYEGLPVMTEKELFAAKPDAIFVETDVMLLTETALHCVESGFHIHCDKPLGVDFTLCDRLLSTAKKNGSIVSLGYMYRFNPAIRHCIDAVKSGSLGRLFEADAVMSTCHDPEYRKWLSQFPGGDMYIFGSHLIDLILRVCGLPDKIHPFLSRTGFDGVDCPDNCLAVFEYKNGLIATVRSASCEVNGYNRRQLVVCGEKGSFEIKPLEKPTVIYFTEKEGADTYGDSKKRLDIDCSAGRYDEMLHSFASAIEGHGRENFDCDYETALHKTILQACGISI